MITTVFLIRIAAMTKTRKAQEKHRASYPCHTLLRSAGDRFALPDVEIFHQSAVTSPKTVKSMTPGSLQYAIDSLIMLSL